MSKVKDFQQRVAAAMECERIPRYVHGGRGHMFGDGTKDAELHTRFVFDRVLDKVCRLQTKKPDGEWVDATEVELARSRIGAQLPGAKLKSANRLVEDDDGDDAGGLLVSPKDWGLEDSDELPLWAQESAVDAARTAARQVLCGCRPGQRVSELYDIDADFAGALRDLVGKDFEYPDFSHLTVKQAISMADRAYKQSMAGDSQMQQETKEACQDEDYVILVAAALEPHPYLAYESDEDDGEVSATPPRTRDAEMALRFAKLSEANDALEEAVKRYPENAFRLDVVPKLDSKPKDAMRLGM